MLHSEALLRGQITQKNMNNVLRSDLFAISKLIKDEEKILDVGCSGNL